MTSPEAPYPAQLSIDYQEQLNRVSSAFRLIFAIPIFVVLAALSGGAGELGGWDSGRDGTDSFQLALGGAGVLFLPTLLLIVFRQKYPRWWFDWNLELSRFSTRVIAYVALLGDRYPSTDEEQHVHLDVSYPDVPRDLNRWLPLVKWFLAIPHFVVLVFLGIAALVSVIIAWFAILFTGRYPRGLFDFVVGVMRWGLRVEAYALLLTTDRYPPFSLEPR